MSHLKQYKGDSISPDSRELGDEWFDWDGKEEQHIKDNSFLFLSFALLVLIITDIAACGFMYLISPRLAMWHDSLPRFAWGFLFLIITFSALWFTQFAFTVATKQKFLFSPAKLQPLFDLTLAGAFRIAGLFGVSRDRMGHSFVLVSNNISRALKPKERNEKLLLLLPRCLRKELIKEIYALKDIYPIVIHTVSGGELARKKVKELKPTAVIGIACERDLVSGIRDVATKFSVIGIPNIRPEGPCKNTHIQMSELIEAIEFFVGKPAKVN